MLVSIASVKRQISRDGARWGLFPLEVAGRLFVAENTYRMTPGPGCGDAARTPAIVCEVTEGFRFTDVLGLRFGRGVRTMDGALERRREAEERAKAQATEAVDHELKRDLRRLFAGRIQVAGRARED